MEATELELNLLFSSVTLTTKRASLERSCGGTITGVMVRKLNLVF